MAEAPQVSPQPYSTRYFSKIAGVNNAIGDEYIDDSEFSDSANYMPDRSATGVYIKREGITKADTDQVAAQFNSIYCGRNNNYFASGTTIKSFDCTSRDTGLTANNLGGSWTSFATYDIYVNGTDLRKSSNGTSFSALSGCPAGSKYIAAVNNFLYVGGYTATVGGIRWASLGTAETWPTTNELILTQDENDDVTGLKPYRNALLVTCEKSFQMVTGFTELEQEVSFFSREEGCASHRSIILTPPYGVFWWSLNRGVVWLKPDFTLDYPMVRKIPATLAGLNDAYDTYVHAVWDAAEQRAMFFLFNGAAQATVNLRADYYPQHDSWYLHTGAGVSMAASGSAIVSSVENVYCGGYNPTYLFKISGSTDNGDAIASYLVTKRESYGGPSVEKKCRMISMLTNLTDAATVTYGAYINDETSVAAANSHAVAVGTGGVNTRISMNRRHYKIKHKISDSATTRSKISGLVHDGYVVRGM